MQGDFVFDNHFLVNPHGLNGLIYFHENYHFTVVFTNVANPANTVNASLYKKGDRQRRRDTDQGAALSGPWKA